MDSKKKDLEIICNLQWKNKHNNGGERSNIIGVYDLPSTTLNWETFKSYLLKNSGTPGDDVKVSYLGANDREFPIQSQLDFQIALYAFRRRARNGEIINLKLDRISAKEKTPKITPTSNDVQTQFDNDRAACSSSSLGRSDVAPQWFTDYMIKFKKDIHDEISTTVSRYVCTIKSHGIQSYHSRKSKTESNMKTSKPHLILCGVGNEKEFLKTLKLEKKMETKLDKLESKSKKLKEKKMSLLTKSSDSDAGHSSSKSNSDTFLSLDITQMNAAPVRHHQPVVPHMMGGEVYLHTWEVINTGMLPWTSDTELYFTWGSAPLEPVEKIVPCPPLQPGEIGSINVLLNVPNSCGQYESYWHFHHRGLKFGHWLGCQIIVDKINSPEPLANSFVHSYEQMKLKYDSVNIPLKDEPDMIGHNSLFMRPKVSEPCTHPYFFPGAHPLPFIPPVGLCGDPRAQLKNNLSIVDETIWGTYTPFKPPVKKDESSDSKKGPLKIFIPNTEPAQLQKIELVEVPNMKPETKNDMCSLEMAGIDQKVHDLQIAEGSSTSSENEQLNRTAGSNASEDFIIVNRASCSSPNDFTKEKQIYPSLTEIEEVVLNTSPSKIQIVEQFLNDMDPHNIDSSSIEKPANDFQEPNQNKQIDIALESDDNNNNTEGAQDSSSESISKIDEDASSNSTLNDMVMVNFADDMEEHDTGYAYVVVDGTKVPIPKKYLRSDFLETAEDAPDPTSFVKIDNEHTEVAASDNIEAHEVQAQNEDSVSAPLETSAGLQREVQAQEEDRVSPALETSANLQQEHNTGNGGINDVIDCDSITRLSDALWQKEVLKADDWVLAYENKPVDTSITDVKTNPRKFVFPQNCPGYEVVPESTCTETIQPCQEANWEDSKTRYSFTNDSGPSNQFMKCNIYNPGTSSTNLQYESPSDYQSVFTHAPSHHIPTLNQNNLGSSPTYYSEFYSSDSSSFARVPNYQQTPPELRPQFGTKPHETTAQHETRMPHESRMRNTIIDGFRSGIESECYLTLPGSAFSGKEASAPPPSNVRTQSPPLPIASVVSGAMTMASSALNSAKNVVNRIIPSRHDPEPGVWVNGHWVVTNPDSRREANLQALADMGFWDRDLNASLLARYNDDIGQVVTQLVH